MYSESFHRYTTNIKLLLQWGTRVFCFMEHLVPVPVCIHILLYMLAISCLLGQTLNGKVDNNYLSNYFFAKTYRRTIFDRRTRVLWYYICNVRKQTLENINEGQENDRHIYYLHCSLHARSSNIKGREAQ